MKKATIRRLYRLKVERPELIPDINAVLLAEGGAGAALFPFNSLEEQVAELAAEGMDEYQIAQKLGVGLYPIRKALGQPTPQEYCHV